MPAGAYARSQGGKISFLPEAVAKKNSQTMNLLEGYLNINPTGAGSGSLAIVDKTALSSESDDGGVFVDEGPSGSGQISVYVVRKGDTLASISKMFGVSKNTILWANDIKNGQITVGQELVILPISGVKHIVKKGDTLRSIALKYKGDLNEILDYNGLKVDSKLAAGDIVIIPDGVIATSSTSKPVGSIGGGGIVSSAGYFLRPVARAIKTQGIHGHNGIDLGASVGTPIMAAASGKVTIARSSGYNGGYGLYVVISHSNGTQTLYGHMSSVNVSVGQTVEKGQTIGAVGNTGKSTGPHLHFEVRGGRNPF